MSVAAVDAVIIAGAFLLLLLCFTAAGAAAVTLPVVDVVGVAAIVVLRSRRLQNPIILASC